MENKSESVFAQKPFYSLTVEMFNCVKTHDYETLSKICDDDFGIIDINTTGGSEIVRNRAEWENWFKGLFTNLDQLNAQTWSEITNYEAVQFLDAGYSVVDFDQIFIAGEQKLKFSVISTIIWKLVNGHWKEARYHSSLLSVVPI
ncbi:MAG: nuclear transport factor 2 family protein [Cytophagales bacterium]